MRRYRDEPAHPDMLATITAMVHAALAGLRPRVVVHDTLVWPTVERAAAVAGARQAICLRPRRDLDEYLARPDCPLRRMDFVFVPDDPAGHPRFERQLEAAGIRAVWTGPVFRTAVHDAARTREKLGVTAAERLVVVMSGGGRGNGDEAREHFCRTLAAVAGVARPGGGAAGAAVARGRGCRPGPCGAVHVPLSGRAIQWKAGCGWPRRRSPTARRARTASGNFAATGRYLVNLDADNYIGDTIPTWRALWEGDPDLVIRGFSPNADGRLDPGNGSYGRIGLSRAAFDKLGGYDEELLPMGCQDSDLVDRARAHGMRVVRVPQQVPFAIRNVQAEKVKYTGTALSWYDMWQRNLRHAEDNLRLGRLTVNNDRAPVKVLLNFTQPIEL
ncbi:hypothetical protein K6I33_000030 [Streptomyces sp. UNOB3_S3]|nr:hypothetical protein [Streptomyces sp. UNOB3_S3]